MINLKRINELAKKQREVGLTEDEKKEQAALRREYIDSVVGNLKSELDNTYVVRPDGVKTKLSEKALPTGKNPDEK